MKYGMHEASEGADLKQIRNIRPQDLMKRVKSSSDIPEGRHYAVIIFKTEQAHIPGDERSKQCPGHGYPAHTRNFDTFEYWLTTNLDDLQAFIVKLDAEGERYVFLDVANKGNLSKSVSFAVGFGK